MTKQHETVRIVADNAVSRLLARHLVSNGVSFTYSHVRGVDLFRTKYARDSTALRILLHSTREEHAANLATLALFKTRFTTGDYDE